MGRVARVDVADQIYHVINRAVGRLQIFTADQDYKLFEDLLLEAQDLTDMRILAHTLMPNHWHLQLYPRQNGDLEAHGKARPCHGSTKQDKGILEGRKLELRITN